MFQRYRDIQERRHSFDASENGFTLIELLIVIVVLGILAAIVVFSLSGVTGQSKAAACTSDGKTVEIAADAYEASNSSWPTNSSMLIGTYLHSWPNSPSYTIGLSTSSAVSTTDNQVLMGTGTAAPSVNYTDTAGCASLGS